MITTVTINAAIDKTYYVNDFNLNHVNRVSQMAAEPGGKGNNVAKVLKTLGIPVTATGFAGGYNGRNITDALRALKIEQEFVETAGESRICLNIIDSQNNTQTEILESGPVISENEWQLLKIKIKEQAKKSEMIIFSGSLAKGVPVDAYKQLIEIAQDQGSKAVLDTSGDPLSKALEAAPYLIKPNQDELANLFGKDQLNEYEILDTMRMLNRRNIPIIVVSLGQEGSIVCHHGEYYKVSPPSLKIVNPVGCGDTLVAGIAAGIYRQLDIIECLMLGTAAAAANALEKKAGKVNIELLEKLKQKVKIEKVHYA